MHYLIQIKSNIKILKKTKKIILKIYNNNNININKQLNSINKHLIIIILMSNNNLNLY